MVKYKPILFVAYFMPALSFILSCSSGGTETKGEGFTGSYDSVEHGGQIYRTVQIGEQVWFAENLNYAVEGGRCYENDDDNCSIYGRLYNWSTAIGGICPDGWRIPSDDDWDALVNHVGNSSTAGRYLKATSGWNEIGNGTDTYGFSALPGGFGLSNDFNHIGRGGYWWSSSEYNSNDASYRNMIYDSEYAYHISSRKSYLLSVRCIKG